MSHEQEKKCVAQAALDYISGHSIIGVGTGSTVNYFIEALEPMRASIDVAVASSIETERRLRAIGISVQSLNYVGKVPNQMGDNLPAIDLGTGKTAVQLAFGGTFHTCALLNDRTAKCWGGNGYGRKC